MKMIFLFMLLLSTVVLDTEAVPLKLGPKICPSQCTCGQVSDVSVTLVCNVDSPSKWGLLCREISNHAEEIDRNFKLKLTGDLSNFNESFSCLSKVDVLDLSNTFLMPALEMFRSLNSLSVLNLSFNAIQNLPANLFTNLALLTEIDLSHNKLKTLDSDIFNNTPLLNAVDISYNNLSTISHSIFSSLAFLKEIQLENNSIKMFSTKHIFNCTSLQKLNLRSNLLKAFLVFGNDSETLVLQNLQSLDISNNPLECSCVLDKLLQNLPNVHKTLVKADLTVCNSPPELHRQSILSLNQTDLACTTPHSLKVSPTNETSILITSTLVFRCSAKGYPLPSVMWVTPWGDIFYSGHKEALLYQSVYISEDEEIYVHRKYEEPNVDITTTIQVDGRNNLLIDKFRGSMSGNYTCIAFNEAGNFSLHIQVSAFAKLKPIMIQSLFIGGYCASGFLIIGLITGLFRALAKKLRHKLYFNVPQFSKPASECHPENNSYAYSVDNNKDSNGSSGKDLSVSSFSIQIAEELPETDSSEGSHSPKEWKPRAILEYLEDSKGRLRHGVGRKMQRVRRNVQSMKESGSVYVHSIVVSGSSAARTMRAGVVMGVETVKYHVQSFKELCGTGDMGTQTISMVSVETDVDSNQSKEIVKQVTFV